MDALLAEKMALETKWNNTYLTKGVYTIDMKSLESKINDVKTKIIQRDIIRAKVNTRYPHQNLYQGLHRQHLELLVSCNIL